MKSIDIIIPIYNAYEYVEECIKSVIKYTNLNENNLILINDCSPDKKIMDLLNNFKIQYLDKNMTIINNEKNLGFVKSVNIGMKTNIGNDVVLLNSDTEVTKSWLEKMKECAYSNKYIATVTPFTNNGTIASVPNFGEDNIIPENMNLDEYAKMIEECSSKIYPEIPTGNGFCLYIKREALNNIGYFDEELFEKGYGEENDFCFRALNHGYINVICDNTFIYHKGTQSFKKENMTKEKAELIENHLKIIKEKYPFYSQKLNEYMASNKMQDIHKKIKINIELYAKKRIAFFINEWNENMEMTGGSSLHVKDIVEKLIDNNYACFIICPNYNEISRMEVYLYTKKIKKLIFSIKTEKIFYSNLRYSNQSYRRFLENLFDTFKFDIVHIHHLLFQTFDIYDIAEKYNSYIITTIHDLYTLCPNINMVYKGKYCTNTQNCLECIKDKYNITENIIDSWRENCNMNLSRSNKIIVPSSNTKKIIQKVYNNLKIDVIEHGVEVFDVNLDRTRTKTDNDINIAFVGAMAVQKGSEILKSLIDKNIELKSNIKIHLFGKTFDEKLAQNKENYIFHGQYKRGELPRLLVEHNINLVCMFTVWPETYSYTLSEVYMSKIPVLAFDIGAISDRLKEDKLGFLIPVTDDTELIINKIKECINSKEYNEILENFKNHKFKTKMEMQNEYLNLYENINIEKNKVVFIEKIQKMQDEVDLDDLRTILKNKDNEIKDLRGYINSHEYLVERFNKLQNTFFWKAGKKIKRIFK